MTQTRTQLVVLATIISAGTLAGAFFLQHVGGLIPCEMCFWHRYPHAILIGLGLLALIWRSPLPALLAASVAAISLVIAIYHSGVERKWWAGPDSCTGGQDLSGLSGTDLLDFNAASAIVNCDEVSYALFGMTLANANVFVSLVLIVIWGAAARRT
ncbi:disulfide bond formation protein DsbB [Aliiruegeria haliotis]|uniref:Disulfide bond formation protein DsbB n=1 Tax=Aliiruegeria haliotis TaxID=1280846 RepID=A0A2T0RZU5_9RHOB|nr:disulfide bond formation protein B [Aliiruegeria haliotis]PRY26670.1 disulfide bond formation protein DsbB [Aliiruegeria haliotis]